MNYTTKYASQIAERFHTGSITDDYALACADASGDGKLNMGDISRVYSHIRETKPLF